MCYNVNMIEYSDNPDSLCKPCDLEFHDKCDRAVMVFDDEIWEDFIPNNTEFKAVPVKNIHGREFDDFRMIQSGDENILLIYPSTGAPAAVCEMELLIASGIRKIVAFGTGGRLSGEMARNTIIVPNGAVREEGTSYHYLPEAGEIKMSVDKVEIMGNIFKKYDLTSSVGKVWTTDAVYRETVDKVELMRERGCVAVDMEMSALIAVAKFRRISFAGFLIADDVLGEEEIAPILRDNKMIFEAAREILENI